ncbi:anti-sigma factor [Planococcus sp. A6]|uniref:anti sigma factor C-terminal domain-containing protein n=1 Tax=Planococcus sp. A6 TaxID=2992760 RepID=UPI00237A9853|nr:anti sigma factor C-terminal domain-containing protein [Planococcus sp. A6]MDE0582540.1 anti-sigma factor [Planococcus sp. A6]
MTENKKDKELNQLFDSTSSNDSFTKIIGRARRKTLLRTAAISSIVLVLFIIISGISWLSLMRWQEGKAMRDIEMFSQITDPNVEEMGMQHEGNGLFEGIIRFERYKVIEGIPVDWSEDVMSYSLFGGVSRFAGDHSPIQVEKDGQLKAYDRDTKQRMLNFYHPEVEYSNLADGLSELELYPEQTVAEVALSFDKGYAPSEVNESMPDGVTLKWYWVDTYSSEDLNWLNHHPSIVEEENSVSQPELGDQVYGFENIELKLEEEEVEESQIKNEELFIEKIQMGLGFESGKYYGEYKRIHDLLKGEAPHLTADHVQIIGAVVTGDIKSLQSLQDLEFVRTSALGVTVDPYQ